MILHQNRDIWNVGQIGKKLGLLSKEKVGAGALSFL